MPLDLIDQTTQKKYVMILKRSSLDKRLFPYDITGKEHYYSWAPVILQKNISLKAAITKITK